MRPAPMLKKSNVEATCLPVVPAIVPAIVLAGFCAVQETLPLQ